MKKEEGTRKSIKERKVYKNGKFTTKIIKKINSTTWNVVCINIKQEVKYT